ncbi:glycosyl transferase, partial [Bifidobacterium catulorum]
DFDNPDSQRQYALDSNAMRELLSPLSPAQRLRCAARQKIRLFENHIHDRRVKAMK